MLLICGSLRSQHLWANPMCLRHSAYSPLLSSSLQEVTASFSPSAHGTQFTQKKKRNTTEETGNKRRRHREGKFTFLFIKWAGDRETAECVSAAPWCSLWLQASTRLMFYASQGGGGTCILQVSVLTSVGVLKVKISCVYRVKCTTSATRTGKWSKISRRVEGRAGGTLRSGALAGSKRSTR